MFLFKDLRPGNCFYVLDKENAFIQKGTITNVSPPHPEAKMGMGMQQVVDVTVNIEGKTTTYVAPESVSVTYCGPFAISGDKDCILNESRSIQADCEQKIANIGNVKEILSRINVIISDLDDAFREKQENDARLLKLENMIESCDNRFSKMEKMMQGFLDKFS